MAEFVNPGDYTAKKRACEAYSRFGNRMQCISYDFKPGDIWKFEILVSEDGEKADLNGLNVPSRELKELEDQQKIKVGVFVSTFFGVTSERMAFISKGHTGQVKLLTGVLFIALAGLLFLLD